MEPHGRKRPAAPRSKDGKNRVHLGLTSSAQDRDQEIARPPELSGIVYA
jgi:hypothetical protein